MGSERQWLPHGQYKKTRNIELTYKCTTNDYGLIDNAMDSVQHIENKNKNTIVRTPLFRPKRGCPPVRYLVEGKNSQKCCCEIQSQYGETWSSEFKIASFLAILVTYYQILGNTTCRYDVNM